MRRSAFLFGWLIAGYAFLSLPIALLVVFSVNDARLTTVWGGFSWRWYAALLRDEQLIRAAWLSLRVAAVSAAAATALGTLAAVALTRFGRFRGATAFAGLLAAPLVLPDVLIGLSLLLLFVAMEQAIGWPAGRGAVTITLAHATCALSYVTLVIRARLEDGGIALEEAAADLGAPPVLVFATITLPLLAPALLAGFLLAFTLSVDDLVVASFVSGPGATTLPMVVFSKLHLGATPELDALATVLLAAVAGLLGLAWLLHRHTIAARPTAD